MHPTKLQLPQEVTLMEVSPRDGLQNESVLLSTDAKLQLIDYALAAGCQRIEAVSFVHPKKVPQMADAEAVCAGLPQRGDVKYTGLILNERGYDRLLATERINEAGLVIAASDTFGLRNQGQDVLMAQGVLARGRAARFEVQATIAVAFGCPFEGDVSPTRVVEMASALADAGATEIGLADTIGVAVPAQVFELFSLLRERLGPEMPLRGHFHDTRNTGIANAFAALQAGVATLDASIGGIGGCPFAPNATGNIATEDLLYMLNRSSIGHGVALDVLLQGAAWLETALDKQVPSALLKSGNFPTTSRDLPT